MKSRAVCAGPGCDVELFQPATGRRRRYCSARCKQAAYRAGFRNTRRRLKAAPLEPMDMKEHRTYGGHRAQDHSSVIDACRSDKRIDAELRRILGAVPCPRAPRDSIVELQRELIAA